MIIQDVLNDYNKIEAAFTKGLAEGKAVLDEARSKFDGIAPELELIPGVGADVAAADKVVDAADDGADKV